MQVFRRARGWALALLVIPLLLLAAFLVDAGGPPRWHARAPEHPAPGGVFRVAYGPARDPDLGAWRTRLAEDHVLERAAARLNAFVRLPSDVVLSFDECGDDDAYYEKSRVTFCYEEVADYGDALAGRGDLDERQTRQVEEATSFFLFHEAGHALVDLLSLPVTGKEEDAVDQFAVYLLERSRPPDARGDALGAAEVLGRLARTETADGEPLPLWDVHSLDDQRRANLLCWLYGADPATYRGVVRREGLPRERRVSCEDEFDQLAGSWDALLAPYLRARPTPLAAVATHGHSAAADDSEGSAATADEGRPAGPGSARSPGH